jgi:hypothetical protein
VTSIKRIPSDRFRNMLDGEHACVVMITCGEPTAGGDMPVEMLYEGDAGLACFLLENAQEVLSREIDERPR